jgi:O-antigen/teichoic acid export membrane protein
VTASPESSVGSKIKEAGRHSVVYGLGSIAQSAVGLALLPILTGSLTPNDFGVYSLILMASAVASAVFYLGMTSALPRSYFDYQSQEDRRAVFTTAFLVLLTGACIQIAVGYFGGSLVSRALVGGDQYAVVVAWAFFASAVSFINQYFFTYLRILRKSTVSVVFSLIGLPGGIGLTLLLLALSPGDLSAPFQAIALTQFAIMMIFIGTFGRVAFVYRFQKEELTRLIPFGIGSVVASFGSILLDWADRLVVEHYMTLADVGSYSAAVRIGTLVNIVLVSPFAQVWSPMMMEYRFHANIKELFSKVLYYFLIIGFVTVGAASLFVGDFLPLLVRSVISQQMITVVLLVMLGALIYGTTNIFAAGLLYERKVSYFAYVYYVVAAIKVGLNIIVIPAFGIVGAALATLLASTLVPVGIYALARYYFAFAIEWRRIAMLATTVALPFAYGLLLWTDYPFPLLARMLCFLLVCAAIFRACLSLDERRKVIEIFRQFSNK